MKTWMSLVLVLVCGVASAEWRLHSDGYYYNNNAGSPYTRSYSNGCYYYTPYVAPYVAPSVVYKTEKTENYTKVETRDFRNDLIGLAGKIEENELFDRSFAALASRWARGKSYMPYHKQGLAIGGDAYGGNTVYSSKVEDVFGNPADVGELTGRFLRSFDSQRELASEIGRRGGELIDAQADRQERVAEILAKGQVARDVLKASDPQPRSRTATTRVEREFATAGGSTGAKAKTYCASCHSGASPSGHFDLSNPSPEQLEMAGFAIQIGAGLMKATDAAKILGHPVRGMPPKGKVPKEDVRELLSDFRGVAR